LTEIAPGIDLSRDVLDQMEFDVRVSSDLKEMPVEIFTEKWGKLAEIMEEKK